MATRFISVKEVSERVCLCKSQIYDRLRSGTFPRSVALGPKKVVFVESEIDAWMQARLQDNDTDDGFRRTRALKAVRSRSDRSVVS
jgi:prophage regulatory protein